MMKFILTLLFGIIVSANINAQEEILVSEEIDISLSDPYRVVDSRSRRYLTSDRYIVAAKNISKNEYVIQTFDKGTLKLIATNVMDQMQKKEDVEHFTVVGDRFWMFYSKFDKPNSIENLYCIEINPETAGLMGEPKKLLSVKGKLSGNLYQTGFYQFAVTNKFRFERSRDKNLMMIRYRMKPEVKDDHASFDQIGLYIFDNSFDELWGIHHTMKRTEAEINIIEYTLDSKGSVFILAKVFNKGTATIKDDDDGKVNYSLELISIEKDQEDFHVQTIEMEDDKYLDSSILYEINESEMALAGYYENGKSSKTEGVFVFYIDKFGDDVEDKVYHEIPQSLQNSYESEKQVKKNKKNAKKGKTGANSLYLDKVIFDSEGNVTLIGEKYWSVTRTYTSNGKTRTTTTYFYSDILVSKIANDGALEWMVKIPKNQQGSSNKGGMSYKTLVNDESIYLLYLDHKENLKLPENQAPERHLDGKGGFFTSVQLDKATGEVRKEHLFDVLDVKGMKVYQFSTNRIVQLNDGEIAIEMYKKKKEDVWIRVGIK